jgi:SAM-dependent methyltransferase
MDALLPHLRRFEALHEEAAAHYRAMQIAVHDYLPEGRQSASADSVRLASWFPDSLGDTLEVGSGYGVLARTFIDRTDRYVGLDLTLQQARAIDRLGGTGVVGDIHALPFPDSRFDTVVADNVIEHALDPLRALTEIRRVLKASGRGYFVIPLDYLAPDYSNDAHLWKADERSIQAAFEAAGFEVIKHEICVLPEIGAQGSFPSCDQRTSLWEVRPVGALTAGAHVDEERIVLDWRAMLRVQAPDIADIADRVTRQVLALNTTSDLTPLARKSPALRDFDWTGYLQLSQIRIVRTASCLVRRGVRGRVLDIGSYFGNFAMTLAELGFEVTALDGYAAYAPAFDQHVTAMRAAGVTVADTAVFGTDLTGFDPEAFDAVLCMGVIEHVPHTPRLLLAAMDRVLKRGGLLVIDTPNLAYEYKRQQMSKGLSVFAPIETQFETEIPFEGHHREYTPSEVRWMIKRIGYVDLEIEMYDYSLYGLSELRGDDVARWRAMQSDPERRELIFASARKPA